LTELQSKGQNFVHIPSLISFLDDLTACGDGVAFVALAGLEI
jgi:hypothetical protein